QEVCVLISRRRQPAQPPGPSCAARAARRRLGERPRPCMTCQLAQVDKVDGISRVMPPKIPSGLSVPALSVPARPVPADVPVAPVGRRTGAFARLLADRWALAGAAVAAGFALLALFAPLLSGITASNPFTYHLSALTTSGLPKGPFGGVSASHWLGVEPQTGR